MATNKILIISLTFILTTYCQEQITEELHLEENEETPETTQIYTEDYKTTTAQEELKNTYENRSIDDERVDGDDFKRREYENDTKYNVDEDVNRTLDTNVVDKDDSVENTTDYAVDVTQFSQNNDVDISHINFTNNIDIDTRTETTPVQTTTKSIVEEDTSRRIQDSGEEVETTGSRIPKADNDSERSFPENEISIPQSTKSIVRGWLEDSWLRAPIGILVPLRSKALNRALGVWSDLNTSTLNLSEVCLMAYDENGVSWRSKHDLHPTSYRNHDKTVSETLSKLLLKYQGVNTVSRTDGTMRALTGAAKLVPYDSALFVFTDEGAGDAQRLPLALRAVIEKRLKVFTIWTNPNYARVEEEGGIQALQNISKHTEGDFMPYPLQVIGIDSSSNLAGEAELEQWDPLESGMEGRRGKYITGVEVDKFDLLVVRRGGGQAISLGVPVENGVTALRVFIEGAVQHAVLYPPNDGPQIDLYNVTSVSSFSQSSRTKSYSPRDVYLVFPGNRLDLDTLAVLSAAQARAEAAALVGMWHLSVRCDTCDYRLCVSARSEVHFDVEINPFSSLKFHVTGPVASVRESQLVDEYGTELAKLSFSYQPISGDGQNVELEPTVELVADVELPPVKGSKVYAKIVGRDIRGEPFVRLSGPLVQPEVRLGRAASIVFPDSTNDLERVEEFNTMMYNSLMQQNNTAEPFSRVSQIVSQQGTLLTAVQIGLASRLYGSPGDRLQLHFEVTNYRDQAVRFSFGARGDQRFLTGINPASQRIASGQTVNVIVSLAIPTSAQPGLRDLITFTAYGNEQISMAAYVYVANPADANDIWAPEVRHNFQGTCLGRTGDDCSQHTWSVTIIARDELSGLLRLSSSPIGLLYSGDFISGTKQEVTATYRATCCAPRLLLNAVDANGNANSYIIDISTHLTDAAIAAIVLGVFLIIALILVIILLIYWCVKKRRESRELPSYNTRS